MKMNKKGFTLIEIIVVIVILAVLMAVAVPSVLKYIDEADDAKYMAYTRSVYTIMQTEITKELINDSNSSLSSDELVKVLENIQYPDMDRIIGVSIPGIQRDTINLNAYNTNDSLVTKDNIPNTYCVIVGDFESDGSMANVKYILLKENEVVEVSETLPSEFNGIFIPLDE